jgi:hypothetical protein
MIRLAALLATLLIAAQAQAEGPNLSTSPGATPGTAQRLVLAQRSWQQALTTGEALTMLVAIRLARSVTLRPAPAWARTTEGEPKPDAPTGRTAAPDPASAAALAILRNLVADDPDLQDLAYDLDAQLPRSHTETATEAQADLGPGQTDSWRLPLFGEVAAELALIGDGDTALSLTLQDEAGHTVCATPLSRDPALCRLTPARNGFFTATIHNPGDMVNSYRLIGN